MSVRIVVDSTADLRAEVAEQVTVVPLTIRFGEEEYIDGVTIDSKGFYEKLIESNVLPTTSQATPCNFEEVFRPMVEAGDTVVALTVSAKLSGTYQSACIAAEELGHVYPVDSRNLSTGIAQLALLAAEEAAKGETDAEHIAEYIRTVIPRVDVSFVLNNLEFLHKGGRCSGVAALGANLLKLKPCIEVTDGKMGVGKKYRGSFEKCASEYIRDRLRDDDTVDLHRIFLTWSGCDRELIDSLKEEIKSYHNFEEVLDTEAGSTISGHCGPGCLGVLYIHKEK